jgi:hypothetical protein
MIRPSHLKAATAATVALALTLAAAGQASAQHTPHHGRVDRLAFRVMKRAEFVQDEVSEHFRNTPQYRHLAAHVSEMVRLSRHVHHVARDGGTLAHLRADVHRLDRLYHHTREVLDGLAVTHEAGRRAIRHIREAMLEMHDAIRDLRHELR